MRGLVALVVLVAAAQAHAQACPVGADLKATQVVATIAGKPVKLSEVDARAASAVCKARITYQQALHDVRQEALDALIGERLVEAAAKKAGTSAQAFVEAELAKAPPPSEADVRAVFEQFKDRMPSQDFDEMRPQIEQALAGRAKQDAFEALVGRLRDEAKVSVELPPVRLPVEAIGPSKGPKSAPVTIVSFADFECPYCGRAAATVEEVRAKYGDKVRLVFRDFPLAFHASAVPAAKAARCADAQGKFWAMHDQLFEHQRALTPTDLTEHAKAVGLDAAKFAACMEDKDDALQKAIDADMEAGKAVGVEGTPAFFVNGVMVSGAQPAEAFEEIIDRELAGKAKGKK